jgi:hypothetical protein
MNLFIIKIHPMKKVSKLIAAAFTIAALFLTTSVKAQTTPANKFVLSLGVEAGLPTGVASMYNTAIVGGNIRVQYGITNSLAVTFATGGDHFFTDYIPGTHTRYSSFGVGPIKGGVKEFFIPNFYVDVEGGIGREVTQQGFVGGQTKLLISPGVGYANKKWDFGIVYESLTGMNDNYGFVGPRIAYGFGL